MLKYAAIYVWITALLVACGGATTNNPETLTGTWNSVKSEESPVRIEATIASEQIELLILDDDGTRLLYWLGTSPSELASGESFISDADVEALSQSIMGSLDETKEFTYVDGELRFEMGMMGASWIVPMKKVE